MTVPDRIREIRAAIRRLENYLSGLETAAASSGLKYSDDLSRIERGLDLSLGKTPEKPP